MFHRFLVSALFLTGIAACGAQSESHLSNSDELTFAQRTLAEQFAPIVHFHPQELYIPMDPELFFEKPRTDHTEDFFRSSRIDYLDGKQGRTVVNVSEDGTLLQYWLFMPKNGCQGAKTKFRILGPIKIGNFGVYERTLELCNIAIHDGDWENLTIKLQTDLKTIDSVFFSSHGIGNWLPASAIETREGRPYIYAALNSHALYAKDIGFQADTTIAHPALDGILGIDWFQVGDILSDSAFTQSNPSGGPRPIDFDTQKALVPFTELTNEKVRGFFGRWGEDVNAKEIIDLPDIAPGAIKLVLKSALKIALTFVPELKGKSTGESPLTPWGRGQWFTFDSGNYPWRRGLTQAQEYGGSGGDAFDDYGHLRDSTSAFTVNSLSIRTGDRVDQVCMHRSEGGDQCHGGNGGEERTMELSAGEFIKRQEMAFGMKDGERQVFAIRFTSNRGRVLEGGTWTSDRVELLAPDRMQIVGWRGSAAKEINTLGAVYGTLENTF